LIWRGKIPLRTLLNNNLEELLEALAETLSATCRSALIL
jgi:hypothetical protein